MLNRMNFANLTSSPTLTCSLEVTAQNTISAKFCEGNILKHIPPITRFSLIRASEWCFLRRERHEVSYLVVRKRGIPEDQFRGMKQYKLHQLSM